MRFDLTDLQLFVHILDCGTLTAAAGRSHMTLASASERVRGMEAQLGCALLARQARGVRPTAAGHTLGQHARDVLARMQRLRGDMAEMVNTPEIRIAVPEDRKFAIIEDLRDRLVASGAIVESIDGARVRTIDGWWLLRASNTQNALTARAEASDAAGLARLLAEIESHLRDSGVDQRLQAAK